MSEPPMPNPVDLYQRAAQATQRIIAGVKADQQNAATPCSAWNVQGLINHLVQTAGFATPPCQGPR